MEDQLYVRIRGRVQGPYELDKLRALVRRGQLSRMHQVSPDGTNWRQASEYAELFASPAVEAAPPRSETPSTTESAAAGLELEPPSPESQASWYYAHNNVQSGPVTFERLTAMAQAGAVHGEDLVWTEGMGDWMPAQSVRGLFSAPGTTTGFRGLSTELPAKIESDVIRTLSETRPWTMFVAICAFVFAATSIALGTMAIILGSRSSVFPLIAGGFCLLLYAAVFIWGGQLLVRFNSSVGKVIVDGSQRTLDSALRTQRTFWIFSSIVLTVVVVNSVIAAIWVFSAGMVVVP